MQKVFHRLLTHDRVDKIGLCRLEYRHPDGFRPMMSTGWIVFIKKYNEIWHIEKLQVAVSQQKQAIFFEAGVLPAQRSLWQEVLCRKSTAVDESVSKGYLEKVTQ